MSIFGILGGIASLGGLLSSSGRVRRLEQERALALAEMRRRHDSLYQDYLRGASSDLYGMSGSGQDVLRGLASSLGDRLASGGVYNASVVAGSQLAGQRELGNQLARLASDTHRNALNYRMDSLDRLDGLRLGDIDRRLSVAQSDLSGSRNSLASLLGTLVQENLMRTGANRNRGLLPSINGLQNQADNLPGNPYNMMYRPFSGISFGGLRF